MIKSISRQAFPIFMASTLNVMIMLINFKMIANLKSEYFFLLSLFSIINYLIIANSESFRATVSSAYILLNGKIEVSKFLNSILLLSILSFILISIIIILFESYFIKIFIYKFKYQTEFLNFSICMIYANMISCSSYIVCSLFNIIKKSKNSFILGFLAFTLNLLFSYLLSRYFNAGIYSIPLGLFISSFITWLSGYYWLI